MISEVSLTWYYWESLGYYALQGVSFKVTNSGDLPIYVDEGKISIDGAEKTCYFFKEPVLPGEEHTFNYSLYISNILPGDKTFTLELEDDTGKVIASFSAIVTPSE
jgi:hypothetical protein